MTWCGLRLFAPWTYVGTSCCPVGVRRSEDGYIHVDSRLETLRIKEVTSRPACAGRAAATDPADRARCQLRALAPA